MKMTVGVQDYLSMREAGFACVDMTSFVKTFLDDAAHVRIVCMGEHSGKTTLLAMLADFFDLKKSEECRPIFEGTAVASMIEVTGKSCMDYQGKYPVVFLSLKSFMATADSAMFMTQMAATMGALVSQYSYLWADSSPLRSFLKRELRALAEDRASNPALCHSLYLLTEALQNFHGQRVMVFVDDYDVPVQAAKCDTVPFEHDVLDFLADFFGAGFKGNSSHVAKVLMAGVVNVPLSDFLMGGLNNAVIATPSDKTFAQYFCFARDQAGKPLDEEGTEPRVSQKRRRRLDDSRASRPDSPASPVPAAQLAVMPAVPVPAVAMPADAPAEPDTRKSPPAAL